MAQAPIRDILLMEDSPADIYLIQKAAEECGPALHLSVVRDGAEARAFLHKEAPFLQAPSPALILLDLKGPHVQGHRVLADLRHSPGYEATPIIVFSAWPREEEEQRCLQLGATAYVQKPLHFHAYFAVLKALICRCLT